MEAGVSLTAATKVGTARSFVMLEPRRCDEHRPQSRVQPQKNNYKVAPLLLRLAKTFVLASHG